MRRVFFAVLAVVARNVITTPVIFYTRGRRYTRAAGVRAVRPGWAASFVIGLALVASLGVNLAQPLRSNAAVSDNLNFQARLQTSAGSIVPDGNYNIEFKLYNASSGGSALWTEDYLNSASHGVTVVNGYVSVNLGSVTPFPGTISWDQSLYVTMNIGGTDPTTPGWDGEMDPRLKLTAVPYAFQAKSATQLQASNGANVATLSFTAPTGNNTITIPDSSGTVCLQGSSSCGFAAASGSGNYIQNTASMQTAANFNIKSAATGSVTASIQALTGQSADLLQLHDQDGNVTTAFGSNGSVTIQDSSAHVLFGADTSTGNLTVGTATGTASTTVRGGSGGVSVTSAGGIALDSSGDVQFTTPNAGSVDTRVSIPVATVAAGGHLLTMGLASGSDSTAQGLTVYDGRTSSHSPSIGVVSPDENSTFGLSWDGSNDTAVLSTVGTATKIGISPGGSTGLVVQSDGKVGIGNASPDYQLDVGTGNSSGYVARIQNTSTASSLGDPGASANGLLIQLGVDNGDRTTGNYFIGFSGGTSGAGTIAGKIQGGVGGVAYTTSGADYAEYFKADANNLPQPGDIVSLDTSTAQGVVRSGGATAPFGIVSGSPGFLGNGPICNTGDANCDSDYQKYNVIVGMNGQVPAKVAVANGAINIGDAIMASATPGVGVKASGYSRIIGYAEEATTVDGIVKVLIQPGIHDPAAAINFQGGGDPVTLESDLIVQGNTTLSGTLEVGSALSAPSISVISANVSGDLTVVGSTTTGNLTVLGSANIQNLTVGSVASFAGDTKLTGQVNTRQATLKSFKTSKPITAGSVVILDNRDDHEGQITTTTDTNDSRVIGVAVQDAANAGDTIDVAIGGWVQVRVDTTHDGAGNAPAGLKAGQVISTSVGEGTVQTSPTPTAGSILGKTTAKQDSNNLVWIMITLQ
jgi:hypothetical protein